MVTIIIPTFNRPRFLHRILDYYNKYGNDFKIILADSSSDENKKNNAEIISSFSGLDILYINKYPSNINPWHKFADVINYVKTKYSVFCADDDFIIPKGIKESVDFFEENPDFTVVHGRYFSFYLKTKRKVEFYWKPIYPSQSIIFSDAKNRLVEYLSNYSIPTIYGVHRTDFFKMIFQESLKFTNDVRFGELLLSMLTLIYGKMKCLDILYSGREIIFNDSGATFKNINDFIKDGSYEEKYNRFRDCLAIHLSKNSQLGIEESKKVIYNAMCIYLKKNYPNDYKHFLKAKMKSILDYLPGGLSKKIKSFYLEKKLIFSKKTANFLNLDNPSSKYYDDFNKIRDCVMSHTEVYEK